jgi:hypothetical protein
LQSKLYLLLGLWVIPWVRWGVGCSGNINLSRSRDIWSHIEFADRRISDGFDRISFKRGPRKSRGPFIPVCRMQRVINFRFIGYPLHFPTLETAHPFFFA